MISLSWCFVFFFFQAEDGIRDSPVTGVQTCALPISIPNGNAIYDWLYELLDFENEKRLIVYGAILIIMMIIRPQGLLTNKTVRRLMFWKRSSRDA